MIELTKEMLVSYLQDAISVESIKKVPNIDRLEALESDLFYLTKADQVQADWQIKLHTETAKELCDKAEKIMREANLPIIDPQGLAH